MLKRILRIYSVNYCVNTSLKRISCVIYIIYDKPLNESFKKQIELVQYNAALIITGAIKGTCRDKIYQELGLESLADRR